MSRTITTALLSLVALPTFFYISSLKSAVAMSSAALTPSGVAAMLPVAVMAVLLTRMVLQARHVRAA